MTLNIAVSTRQGSVLATDHRFLWGNGRRRDDRRNKQIVISCYDGDMLVGYCGIGAFRDDSGERTVDDWLTEVVTSPPRVRQTSPGSWSLEVITIADAIKRLRDEATSRLGKMFASFGAKGAHYFTLVGESKSSGRFVGVVCNRDPRAPLDTPPNNWFDAFVDRLPNDVSAALFVPRVALTPSSVRQLNSVVHARGAQTRDIESLLAKIILSSATKGPNRSYISPTSTTTFTDSGSPTLGFSGRHHGLKGVDQADVEPRVITWGVPNPLWADIWSVQAPEAVRRRIQARSRSLPSA